MLLWVYSASILAASKYCTLTDVVRRVAGSLEVLSAVDFLGKTKVSQLQFGLGRGIGE